MNKEGWEVKKLGDISDCFIGMTYKPENVSDKGTIVLRSGNIQDDKIDLNDLVRINKIISLKHLVKDNDVLMCSRNGSHRLVGKCTLIKGLPEKMTFGAFMTIIRSEINNYLIHFFRSPYFRNQLTSSKTSTINQITVSMLRGITIPVPPLPIQEQIVAELDTLNDILAKKRQQLTELDTLAQATFYHLFGDPVENEKGWEVKKLEEVCSKITDGEHGTVERLNSGVLYLMARNITQNGILNLDEVSFISKESHQKIFKRCNPSFQDVLLVCVGATIGKSCLVPRMEEFSIARSVALLKPDKKYIVPYYLFAYTKCYYFKQQIQNSQHAAAQAGLYIGKIKDLKVILPPLALQNQFAEQIEAIEKQKELINRSITEVQKLLDYTMDKYFN